MSEGWVCGTGFGNFPKPGDPDNNSILTATPAFGGIDVEWTYPAINPHAVAHVIVYRSTSPKEDSAVRHVIAAGNFFYDKTTTATPVRYYYWIQIVSVNGTVGPMIGPASAAARPSVSQMLELLTDQIDSGVLAQSLKTEIGRIETNKLAIDKELKALAAFDETLGVAYNEVLAYTQHSRALLQEEVLARATAEEALVTAINTVQAHSNNVSAAVQEETQARIERDSALAMQITTAQSQLDDEIASVRQTFETRIESVNGKVQEIGALYTAQVDVNGLIGGFGVYNDGTRVEAGFDVDRFWVGRTKNKVKPFIIENEEVFIDQAVVKSLVFTKLRDESGAVMVKDGKLRADYLELDFAKVSGAIQSNNYLPGYSGWRLDKNGVFENNGITPGRGRKVDTNNVTKVYDASGRLRVQIGDLWA
ncbi:phage tail tip fiber protein [Stutzerimonas stutzeri]|uniref:Tip attachment protein J central straight fiber domain-containing protein n=1 Tax=Stutzerimonas stutzeri TaxID=316 RepID=A0AA42TGF2_STUST|nr:hypothetical protein [Stutzerimonas stutzeri]MDH1236564.1 hypothetical protein [Stutzerimonas stutzeri]